MKTACTHLNLIQKVLPATAGCAECLALGTQWVELRMCLVCGHVGCCDASPGKHATAHYQTTGHPVMQSIGSGEDWRWCYIDKTYI